MVSEFMLQQTQVSRVIPKYREFLQRFPTIETLAPAPLGSVLRTWNGLGYNRRAKFLHQTAGVVVREHKGRFPETIDELTKLPGIGSNTAGAILAYAFNQPVVFIETNIRTVFIHHFFHDRTDVPDAAILQLVAKNLDSRWPREWYWALMDYGAYLKQTAGNPARQSRSYTKQSRFEGSRRQIRGQVIRLLAVRPHTSRDLSSLIADERLADVLQELQQERLINRQGSRFTL